ncbi:tRNA lysidine(34) synthetase TilS [Sphaerotilus sp.]|uniref:tRNA lysidine(34) synthetase TilS n=1 Tax=Sphaerotilus sp. TaxID=2093942 RepID=UPI0034E20C3C
MTLRPLAVACSGGRDSIALLHATWRAARVLADDTGQLHPIHALHVHHGLSRHADDWLAHCADQCARWRDKGADLQFHARHLRLAPKSGDSVEALARSGRYAALADMARTSGCDTVLLAHHREDQAETFLLQALRGAGAAGLASMPASIWRDGICWQRPWLRHPRAAIEAYVAQHGLQHIEDDSNVDPRYARNRLRLQLWPALTAAFPQAPQVLGDAARHAHDAAECLQALAEIDLGAVAVEDGLDAAAAVALGGARLRNLLHLWLWRTAGEPPRASWLDRLSRELPVCVDARWLMPGSGELRLWRGVLRWGAMTPQATPAQSLALPDLHAERIWLLPTFGGVLYIERVTQGGIALDLLRRLTARPRSGGEQFQRAVGTPPRALKKQYQQAGVPAEGRGGPLLFSGEQLVFVPGLGLDARVVAPAGQPQATLRWHAHHTGDSTDQGTG